MRTDDGYIIHKCLNGEPEAFSLLVEKYKGNIAFVLAKLHSKIFVELIVEIH